MSKEHEVLIIIPAYNEEGSIENVVNEIKIIIINLIMLLLMMGQKIGQKKSVNIIIII